MLAVLVQQLFRHSDFAGLPTMNGNSCIRETAEYFFLILSMHNILSTASSISHQMLFIYVISTTVNILTYLILEMLSE